MAAVGGIIQFRVDGTLYDAKGDFTYSLAGEKRTGVMGSDGRPHGYRSEGRMPFIEGKITDRGNLAVAGLQAITDATVTLNLANGKTIVLGNAWYAGEGQISTAEGEIDVRFEGMEAEEI